MRKNVFISLKTYYNYIIFSKLNVHNLQMIIHLILIAIFIKQNIYYLLNIDVCR